MLNYTYKKLIVVILVLNGKNTNTTEKPKPRETPRLLALLWWAIQESNL